MNRPIRRVALAFIALFLVLLGNANYVQVFRADDLNSRTDNRRVLLDEYAHERGPIVVAGEPIAKSVKTDDTLVYLRRYTHPTLYADLTGFYSFIYGRSGVEAAENTVLSGTDDRLFVRRMLDLLTNRTPKGGSVLLTIDPAAQQAAADALGDRKGAVVALEPSTGKILAMVSHPSYDPNRLSSHDSNSIGKAWKQLTTDPDKPMLNRATQSRYPPGSTFKLITAAAALESGDYDLDTRIPAPFALDLPQSSKQLFNENHSRCGGGDSVTLEDALRVSCNTAFGGLGLKLGDDALREQAKQFGFGSTPVPELDTVPSVFPANPDPPQTVLSAIGQYDVAATPLQMAMVSAAIANNGTLMKPYLVAVDRGPDLRPLNVTEPEVQSRAMSPRAADELTQMMETVVTSGTGRPAQIPGVKVAGKTGTAQTTPDKPPYAWFTSFAPADHPKVAVAVVIEDADVARSEITGGGLAGPIATAVTKAVIGQ